MSTRRVWTEFQAVAFSLVIFAGCFWVSRFLTVRAQQREGLDYARKLAASYLPFRSLFKKEDWEALLEQVREENPSLGVYRVNFTDPQEKEKWSYSSGEFDYLRSLNQEGVSGDAIRLRFSLPYRGFLGTHSPFSSLIASILFLLALFWIARFFLRDRFPKEEKKPKRKIRTVVIDTQDTRTVKQWVDEQRELASDASSQLKHLVTVLKDIIRFSIETQSRYQNYISGVTKTQSFIPELSDLAKNLTQIYDESKHRLQAIRTATEGLGEEAKEISGQIGTMEAQAARVQEESARLSQAMHEIARAEHDLQMSDEQLDTLYSNLSHGGKELTQLVKSLTLLIQEEVDNLDALSSSLYIQDEEFLEPKKAKNRQDDAHPRLRENQSELLSESASELQIENEEEAEIEVGEKTWSDLEREEVQTETKPSRSAEEELEEDPLQEQSLEENEDDGDEAEELAELDEEEIQASGLQAAEEGQESPQEDELDDDDDDDPLEDFLDDEDEERKEQEA